MARLFGTDGIRGLAFGDVLTEDLARQVAASAVRVLGGRRVVVGRDTRPSGPALEKAAVEGFTSAGADVVLLGVVPTPAVAQVVASGAADLGLVLSASHNPPSDNGLKLFGPAGHKLTDAEEDAIEAGLATAAGALGDRQGTVSDGADLVEGYAAALLSTVGSLAGLTVVVDGAEGAASRLAPEVYAAAGASVVAIHCGGDGSRINEGSGATHPESLAAAVVAHGADLGIAHDGDADRCIVVDGTGRVLNGDQVLGLLAIARRESGLPASDVLVATVMSNVGLAQAMERAGIELVRTAVGDRYVLAAMLEHGYRLGGEQSGHVVLLDHATTGDGLLTALQVMDRVVRTRRPLAELADVVTPLPQVLVNVRAERARATAPEVLAAVAREEAALGAAGRVLLRPSGTEPLVRVMVEAPTGTLAEAIAERLAAVVGRGGPVPQR
ncbi:MAG: phosphoglucosamine mutase [Frankiales bacterium]|nr:phosphoglucosamine mutase [Frankiales bacterium]